MENAETGHSFSVFHFPFSILMADWHETEVRVRYAETDQMGIVHHSNYLVWFEAARSELCRSKGFSYKEMEDEADSLMVVAEAYVRYKAPAFYEDVLTVRTRVSELRSRSIRFIYEVIRESDGTLLAEGETLHLVTSKDKKVKQLPEHYRQRLMQDQTDIELSFPPDKAPS